MYEFVQKYVFLFFLLIQMILGNITIKGSGQNVWQFKKNAS